MRHTFCVIILFLGVSRLMDLLSDSREIIRNEVKIEKYYNQLNKSFLKLYILRFQLIISYRIVFQGLLLLTQLTKSNAAIQVCSVM